MNALRHLVVRAACIGFVCCGTFAVAEQPGEFRPKPVLKPNTKNIGATGNPGQTPEQMPVSRAPLQKAVRKAKAERRDPPQPDDSGDLVLRGTWDLIEAPRVKADGRTLSQPGVDTKTWYDATVPGTVLTTLVDQGVYPDPYFGLNNLAIPESLNKQDYWYRTEFKVPRAMEGRQIELDFGGINYYAEAWLNGSYLGHITGAFQRGRFDVTRLVKPGAKSVLAVMVVPAPDPGVPHEQSVKGGPGPNGGAMCLDGPTFFCTEGWDWIPAIRDRATGIWQDVVLRATGPLRLGDPQVVTRLPLPDTSKADVTIRVEIENLTDKPQEGEVQIAIAEPDDMNQPAVFRPRTGSGTLVPVTLAPHETRTLEVLRHFGSPDLWWPNGYGKPNLYGLQVSAISAAKVSDTRHLRFGIREVTYELGLRTKDGKFRRYEYAPSGVALGKQPAIDIRRSSMLALDEPYKGLSAVALANGAEKSAALRPLADDDPMGPFLVVRVNGQRIFCRGGNWGMDDALKRIGRERLEPYVRMHRDAHLTMIRNWCGQSTSEVFYDLCDEYGLLVWNDFWMSTENWNFAPADTRLFLANVADTIRRYRNHPSLAIWCARNEGIPPDDINEGIDRLVRQLDGTRYYQPNSRNVNLRGSGPWSNTTLDKYFGPLAFGFTTELGACAVPSAEVVRSMMAKEDLWPTGDAWAYHDLHSKGSGDRASLVGRMKARYGEPKDLDDFCRKAQMLNYETWRAMYEGHNAKLWHPCSGVLAWMSHPSWPSVVWEFYTWDYEPGAALFGVQKACEPVHVQMNLPDGRVVVINHGSQSLDGLTVRARVCNFAGKELGTEEQTLGAAARACTAACTLRIPGEAVLVRLELRDASGRLQSDNFYWHAADEKQLQTLDAMPRVAIKATASQTASAADIELTNDSGTPALFVRLTARDVSSGRRVLPIFYSDNYLSLLPGETRKIHVDASTANHSDWQIDVDGWNVEPTSCR